MRRFSEFRNINEVEFNNKAASSDALAAQLGKMVDDFVGRLKQQLVQPYTPGAQRGIWDRVKGLWSNMWHGRYNQTNPYFWKNKLGDDLGSTTESILPLSHFKVLHEQAELLEASLPAGTEKLQIVRIIDDWAKQFKAAILSLAMAHSPSVPQVPTAAPETPASVEKEPEAEPEAEPEPEKPEVPAPEPTQPPARTAPIRNPENVGKNSPKPVEPKPVDDDFKAPSTGNRKWNELTPHEMEAWDNWGGGNAKDVTALSKNAGIKTLPWILRNGDPRLEIIQNLYRGALYNRMIRQHRIESITTPITNKEDLEKAVENAKRLREIDRQKDSIRNKETAERLRKQADEFKPQQSPEAPKSEPDATSSSPETPKEAPETPAEAPPEAPKPRVAKMKLPGNGSEENDKKVEELQSELDGIKDDLNDEIYAKLSKMVNRLKSGGTPEQFDRTREHIAIAKQHALEAKNTPHEPSASNDEEDDGLASFGESTILERTAMTIGKFRNLARR